MRSNHLVAIIAVALIILAIFCPAIITPDGTTISFIGETNFYNLIKISLGNIGYLPLIPALSTVFLIIINKGKYQWINCILLIIAGAIIVYKLFLLRESVRNEIANIPGSFLVTDFTDNAIDSIHLSWGWFLLITAAVLLVISSILSKNQA